MDQIIDYKNRVNTCRLNNTIDNIYYDLLSYRPDQEIVVIRDDNLCGGTKSRLLLPLLDLSYDEYVYATAWYGGMQVALTWTINQLNKQYQTNKKVTIIIEDPYPDNLKAFTQFAKDLGATIIRVPPNLDIYKYAQQYVSNYKGNRRLLIPSGFRTPEAIDELAKIAIAIKQLFGEFDECWCAVGSGALITGLQKGNLAKKYYGVCVFQQIPEIGKAIPIIPDETFDEPVNENDKPPYPSASHYDAKVLRYVKNRQGKILIWNVM